MSAPFTLDKDFPERRSTHTGNWVPVYIELQPGSGERLCVAVVAEDTHGCHVQPVAKLERLQCAFGESAHAIAWAARLALEEIRDRATAGGLTALSTWEHGIDGLSIGERRMGAGIDLADLSSLALSQVSLLAQMDSDRLFDLTEAATAVSMAEAAQSPYDAVAALTTSKLDASVRRIVLGLRPQFKDRFGHYFQASQSSRPLRFGYVGRKLVANFAALTGASSGATSTQVDKAKARLWDLKQLQSGVLSDSLPLQPRSMSYELLVHRPRHPYLPGTKNGVPSFVAEAEEELEAEADKFEIRFRALGSVEDIARSILEHDPA